MAKKESLQLFENKKVRSVWDSSEEEMNEIDNVFMDFYLGS